MPCRARYANTHSPFGHQASVPVITLIKLAEFQFRLNKIVKKRRRIISKSNGLPQYPSTSVSVSTQEMGVSIWFRWKRQSGDNMRKSSSGAPLKNSWAKIGVRQSIGHQKLWPTWMPMSMPMRCRQVKVLMSVWVLGLCM